MLPQGPGGLNVATLRFLESQFERGEVRDRISDAILHAQSSLVPGNVEQSISHLIVKELRSRVQTLEKVWTMSQRAEDHSLEDSSDEAALEIKNLKFFIEEVKVYGLEKAIGCMRHDKEKEAEWILTIKKSSSPEEAVKAAVKNLLSERLEFQKRAAVINFEVRSYNGEWWVNGSRLLDLFKAYREGADRKPRCAELLNRMEGNRSIQAGIWVSEDLGKNRHYIYSYERSKSDPSMILARAIEFKGSLEELKSFVRLLGKSNTGEVDFSRPIFFQAGKEPSNLEIIEAAKLALNASRSPSSATLYLTRLKGGLAFDADALRTEAFIEQHLIQKILNELLIAKDKDGYLRSLPTRMEQLLKEVLREHDLGDYFDSLEEGDHNETEPALPESDRRLYDSLSHDELEEIHQALLFKDGFSFGAGLLSLALRPTNPQRVHTGQKEDVVSPKAALSSMSLLATIFHKPIPQSSMYWWRLAHAQFETPISEPTWSVRNVAKKNIDDPLLSRDPSWWSRSTKTQFQGHRSPAFEVELVSDVGVITEQDASGLWVLYAQSRGMTWNRPWVEQRLKELVENEGAPYQSPTPEKYQIAEVTERVNRVEQKGPMSGIGESQGEASTGSFSGNSYQSRLNSSNASFNSSPRSRPNRSAGLVASKMSGHQAGTSKQSHEHTFGRPNAWKAVRVPNINESEKRMIGQPQAGLRRALSSIRSTLGKEGHTLSATVRLKQGGDANPERVRLPGAQSERYQVVTRQDPRGEEKTARRNSSASVNLGRYRRHNLPTFQNDYLRKDIQSGVERKSLTTSTNPSVEAVLRHSTSLLTHRRTEVKTRTGLINETSSYPEPNKNISRLPSKLRDITSLKKETDTHLPLRFMSEPLKQPSEASSTSFRDSDRMPASPRQAQAIDGSVLDTQPLFQKDLGARFDSRFAAAPTLDYLPLAEDQQREENEFRPGAVITSRTKRKRRAQVQHTLHSILGELRRIAQQRNVDLLQLMQKVRKGKKKAYFMELLILELLEALGIEGEEREKILCQLDLLQAEFLELDQLRAILKANATEMSIQSINNHPTGIVEAPQ